MNSALEGKTALITGATSGIGAETARVLANSGVNVMAIGRREGAARALCEGIAETGGIAAYALGEITAPEFAIRAVSETEDRFGALDILVNAAGTIFRGAAEQTTNDDWLAVLSVNVSGTFYMSRAAIPAMRRSRRRQHRQSWFDRRLGRMRWAGCLLRQQRSCCESNARDGVGSCQRRHSCEFGQSWSG